MKPVDDLQGINYRSITVVLTGDGKKERLLLKPLAKRFNGNTKILLLPTTPISYAKEHVGRNAGFSALHAVKTYLSKYKLTCMLFLIDREYFGQEQQLDAIIGDALRNFGIDVQNIEAIEENAFCLKSLVGGRQVIIYAVVLGEKKCLEEDIAKLIQFEWKMNVEPTEAAIRCVIREKRTDFGTLIENAKLCHLTKAFPGLTSALKKIENSVGLV